MLTLPAVKFAQGQEGVGEDDVAMEGGRSAPTQVRLSTAEDYQQHWARVFKAARRRQRLSQQQVAAQAGLQQGTIAHIENATHIPSFRSVLRLARVLGIALTTLFPPDPTTPLAEIACLLEGHPQQAEMTEIIFKMLRIRTPQSPRPKAPPSAT